MFDYDEKNTFYLIPKKAFDELIQAVKDLRQMQDEIEKGADSSGLGEFIPEDKAMEMLKRGKTWFFNKRKSGELPGKKAAGRWYYKKGDILKYIQNA